MLIKADQHLQQVREITTCYVLASVLEILNLIPVMTNDTDSFQPYWMLVNYDVDFQHSGLKDTLLCEDQAPRL